MRSHFEYTHMTLILNGRGSHCITFSYYRVRPPGMLLHVTLPQPDVTVLLIRLASQLCMNDGRSCPRESLILPLPTNVCSFVAASITLQELIAPRIVILFRFLCIPSRMTLAPLPIYGASSLSNIPTTRQRPEQQDLEIELASYSHRMAYCTSYTPS